MKTTKRESEKVKLAVLTSHPIQYQIPIWREIHRQGIDFQALFLTRHGLDDSVDRDFGKHFSWDIDLLSGYNHDFIKLRKPIDLDRFRGIDFEEEFALRLKSSNTQVLWIEGWRFKAMWDAVGIAKRCGLQVWMRGESNCLKKSSLIKQSIKRILLGRHLSKVDKFLCIGKENRRLYQSYGISDSKLYDAPYCVDNDRFIAQSDTFRPDRDAIRKRWGIDASANVVLFCGKFVEKKHPEHVLKAVSQIVKTQLPGERWHILFVGSGPMGSELKRNCNVVLDLDAGNSSEEQNVSDLPRTVNASFVGFLNQSEIAKAYVAADVLVLPSDAGETWGLVVNEAMSCGTPAVTSDLVGCCRDLPAQLNSSAIYPFGNTERLASSIRDVVRAALTVDQVREMVSHFHVRHTVDSVQKMLKSLPEQAA